MTKPSERNAARSSRRSRFSGSWGKRWFKWAAVGSAGIVVLAVAVLVSRDSSGPAIDRNAILAAELNDPQMLEVERRFVCPCKRCGGLELTECECDGPDGALEMKTMLAGLLGNGENADQATVALSARFGGLKPRSEWRQAEEVASQPKGRDPGVAPKLVEAVSHETTNVQVPGVASLAKIVQSFDCPCGNCDLTLSDCTCDHSGGSEEVKGYIEQRLADGQSAEEVIEGVERSFGARRRTSAS